MKKTPREVRIDPSGVQRAPRASQVVNFNDYQVSALDTALYKKGDAMAYLALGLCGESGEVAEKLKKLIRDNNFIFENKDIQAIVDELGDVLWYISCMANELGISLGYVATRNLEKLQRRKKNNTISGSGDDR